MKRNSKRTKPRRNSRLTTAAFHGYRLFKKWVKGNKRVAFLFSSSLSRFAFYVEREDWGDT